MPDSFSSVLRRLNRWVIPGCLLAAVLPAAAAPVGRIFVSEKDRNRVEVFKPSGERLAAIPTGICPHGMAAQDGKLYVMNRGPERAPGSGITVIDLDRLQIERTLQACEGCAPAFVGFGPQGLMLMGGQNQKTLFKLRPPYTQTAGSIVTDYGTPMHVQFFPASPLALVGFRGGDSLVVVNTATMKATPLPIGPGPEFVAARPGSNELWCALNPTPRLAVVHLDYDETTPILEQYPANQLQSGLAFTSDGKLALISGSLDHALFVVDPDTRKELGRLTFPGADPGLIAASPDGTSAVVLVTKGVERTLVVVDLTDPARPTRKATIPIDGAPVEVLWLP